MKLNEMSFNELNKINKGLAAGEHYDCHLTEEDLAESIISSGLEWVGGVEVPDHITDICLFVSSLDKTERSDLLQESIDCVIEAMEDVQHDKRPN